ETVAGIDETLGDLLQVLLRLNSLSRKCRNTLSCFPSGPAGGFESRLVLRYQDVEAVKLVGLQPGLFLHELEESCGLSLVATLHQLRHFLIEKRELVSNLARRSADARERLNA